MTKPQFAMKIKVARAVSPVLIALAKRSVSNSCSAELPARGRILLRSSRPGSELRIAAIRGLLATSPSKIRVSSGIHAITVLLSVYPA